MLPWDQQGKNGPKKPQPDHILVTEPKDEPVPSEPTSDAEEAKKSIVKRLNSRGDTEEEERSGSQTDDELKPETSQPQFTLKEKLQLEIFKSMKSPDPEVQVQN
ncbi:unnamed protein product [Parnassius apollo]|uniref:(apollo) hypothetical protein n=1 Tax=Parnassius apollo TaxID=110799 RepID=A0A8S3X283_PARAO|nr:unnamed protein product [Parnassius apollo]